MSRSRTAQPSVRSPEAAGARRLRGGRRGGGSSQPGLGERDLVAGRGPAGARGQRRGDGQPALVARRRRRGVDQRLREAGGGDVLPAAVRHLQVARRDRYPAVLDGPAETVGVQARGVLPVPDRDAAGGRVDRDPDRGEHRLGLEQAGRRGPVGEDQAVDDEVAVVHALAEVAAVAEVRFARRGELGDPVVDPLPDEPAVQAGVPVEELGVVGQAARPVAHGVAVFAQHHGQAATVLVVFGVRGDGFGAPADRVEFAVVRVHLAVDVGVEGVRLALVVDQPARVAGPDPARHLLQVPAGPGLVAQRPHDHAGMVLVPLDGALDPVQAGGQPAGIVAGVGPPAGQRETVGLQVALVDHQQAVLVAQVEEPRVRRVVAGPHRVDVVLLHQHDVGPHGGLVQAAPGHRMPLVPVHAAELDSVPVEPDLPVAYLDAAEADPEADLAARAGQDRVVQPGVFVRPGLGRDAVLGAPAAAPVMPSSGTDSVAGRSVSTRRSAGAAVRVVVGVHEEVPDQAGLLVDQGDAAEDAGQPPHVLILQVGPGRPLVHPDRDHIVFGPNVPGYIELPHQPAARAVTDGRAVDEHGEARVDPVEADQRRPAANPSRGQREAPPVLPRRVAVRDAGRVDREGVRHVGVGGRPVPGRAGNAGQLPAGGHLDVVEPAVVKVGSLEARGQLTQALAVAELPGPVQAEPGAPHGLRGPRRGEAQPGAERLDVAEITIGHGAILPYRPGIRGLRGARRRTFSGRCRRMSVHVIIP